MNNQARPINEFDPSLNPDVTAMMHMSHEQRQAYTIEKARQRLTAHEADLKAMDEKFGITIPKSEFVQKLERIFDKKENSPEAE